MGVWPTFCLSCRLTPPFGEQGAWGERGTCEERGECGERVGWVEYGERGECGELGERGDAGDKRPDKQNPMEKIINKNRPGIHILNFNVIYAVEIYIYLSFPYNFSYIVNIFLLFIHTFVISIVTN